MAQDSGSATTKQLIIGAQKSANQLKALLARILPAAGGQGASSERSGSAVAVDALLSDIEDSLSQALASLQIGAQPGQSSIGGGGGGRRSASRRSHQLLRMDGAFRTIEVHNGGHDSFTWRKYGQKDILGSRFPRSYFKCSNHSGGSGCTAKKQVQKSDADPSKLVVTYLGEHTCEGQPSLPSMHPAVVPESAYHNRVSCSGRHGLACAVSTEQEQDQDVLLIPSPACSQSELLLAEVPKAAAHGHDPLPWMGHELVAFDDESTMLSDFAVPELKH